MHWSCKELNDGWVMLACDVYLAPDDQPEAMAGIRFAVHPFHFDENPSAFWQTIFDMQFRAVVVSQPLNASRACAFGG